MYFLGDKSSQYQSVDSSDDGRDLSREQVPSRKHESLSRLAFLAIIIIAQALMLASTNVAAYTLGKMRAEKSVEITRHMNNTALGDPTSTYTMRNLNRSGLKERSPHATNTIGVQPHVRRAAFSRDRCSMDGNLPTARWLLQGQ
jgi:hypothetical protein